MAGTKYQGAGKVDQADGLVIKPAQKASWSATVLDIGLSFRTDCGKKNTHLRPDKSRKIRGYQGLQAPRSST
jgi:hypothetical protein